MTFNPQYTNTKPETRGDFTRPVLYFILLFKTQQKSIVIECQHSIIGVYRKSSNV